MSEEAPPNQEAFMLRLKAKTEKIEALEAKLAEVQTQLAEKANQAERAAEYKAQRDAARAEYKSAQDKWASESAMMQHGLTDPDHRDLAGYVWSKLPEDARKPYENVGAWLADEEGAKSHKLLGHLFQQAATTEAAEPEQAESSPTKREQPPRDDKGRDPAKPAAFPDKRARYRAAMQAYELNRTDPKVRAEYAEAKAEYLG